jgi:hypothetical protein
MRDSRTRKRAEHRRGVMAALRDILNDPAVMPNADCPDLVVNVEFGNTVRDIYVDFVGFWRRPPNLGEKGFTIATCGRPRSGAKTPTST